MNRFLRRAQKQNKTILFFLSSTTPNFQLVYLDLNLDVIPKYIPEIQVKDAFRHLPARLSAIDSLDQSIVDNEEDQPLFCDGTGDEDVVELDT